MRSAITFRIIAQGIMCLALGAAALIYANKANAGEVAFAPNKAGGELILMDTQGECAAQWKVILARSDEGEVQSGCWTITEQGTYVMVLWDSGKPRMYLLSEFTMFNSNTNEVTYE